MSTTQAEEVKPPKVLQSTQKQREMKDASFTKLCEGRTLNAFPRRGRGSGFCSAPDDADVRPVGFVFAVAVSVCFNPCHKWVLEVAVYVAVLITMRACCEWKAAACVWVQKTDYCSHTGMCVCVRVSVCICVHS